MKKLNVKAFVAVGMLSGLAYVLMLLNFPLPLFPSFLKIDFSDIPALIAAIIIGPVAGILVEFIKVLLDFITTGSPTGVPVGHIANFVTGISFVLPTYFIFNKLRTEKGLKVALISGTVITAIVMSVLNYFVFIPMYAIFMNYDIPASWAVTFILPFNLIKGVMITVIFMLLFMKMKDWLFKQQVSYK
ncbi:ECF transporter S component [Bacillus kwashiorkori]|uniref:ECF transporter S component n=1 Tax=Bacillus kwashiorkori TaxID=1522318 RepID=UPI0007821E3B|nr:ECF transporter S component [Bacillus kwashiorkori]